MKLTPGTVILIVIWLVSGLVGSIIYIMNPGKSELFVLGLATVATIVWTFTR